jgi:hypothetical protein
MDRERGVEMRGSVAALKVSFFEVTTRHKATGGREGEDGCSVDNLRLELEATG